MTLKHVSSQNNFCSHHIRIIRLRCAHIFLPLVLKLNRINYIKPIFLAASNIDRQTKWAYLLILLFIFNLLAVLSISYIWWAWYDCIAIVFDFVLLRCQFELNECDSVHLFFFQMCVVWPRDNCFSFSFTFLHFWFERMLYDSFNIFEWDNVKLN